MKENLDNATNSKRQLKLAMIIFGVVELIVTLFVVVYMKKF
jgi:predicted nucleic acid-binding Zn ribbon protein